MFYMSAAEKSGMTVSAGRSWKSGLGWTLTPDDPDYSWAHVGRARSEGVSSAVGGPCGY